MKAIVHKIKDHPNKERVVSWIRLITITGSAQLIVQALGLLSGIIIIRLLPTHEYALYTLANTMLGTMTILADGGISSGVMSLGGKVWQDKKALGIVLATGLDLRRKFAIGSLLIAVPFLFYLLRHHDASWGMTILLILSIIPAFYTALSGTILQIAPKLNQDIVPLQKNGILSNAARLGLIFTLFIFPWAFIAVLSSGVAQLWTNQNLKKISRGYADWKQLPDRAMRAEILVFVKRLLPGSIFFCVSGQITIWLISFFGNTTSVAQIGALGRLGMTLSVVSVLLSTLVIPRFARLPDEKGLLLKKILQLQLGLFAIGLMIMVVVFLFPSQILWVLGKEYRNLQSELILSMAGNCIGLVAGMSFGLATIRGWALHPLIQIPATLAAIVAGILLIDISTLTGILKFNIFVFVVEILMSYINFAVRISKIQA